MQYNQICVAISIQNIIFNCVNFVYNHVCAIVLFRIQNTLKEDNKTR